MANISRDISETIETEVLTEEKQVIIQLQEPQHLTSNSLSAAFSRGSPIDSLIEVLCIPILIAYESNVLQAGHSDDYQQRLEVEIHRFAETCISSLPENATEIRIYVIFVPIENLSVLSKKFEAEAGLI
jgi:hypothetical protein